MAYLLSISLTTPFCYREAKFQGTYRRSLTGGGLINPVTRRLGMKHLLHEYSGGGMIPLKGSCHYNIYVRTRRRLDPVLCHVDIHSSGDVLILGFWMGPDRDDGWGFVEASVHRIY